MGDEDSLPSYALLLSIGIDLHLHPELFREKGMEKKIVIPLEIFNSNAFAIQTLKLMKHGEVILKGRRFPR
jgi:hypothetical protein